MTKETQGVMFSSKNDEWETPKELFERLNRLFSFTLDPAATHENHLCSKYFVQEEDGLKQSWAGETVFVNPPYSQIGKWVAKAAEEADKEKTLVVMLMPARTDTKYFADVIMKKAQKIWFIKGRLKFVNQVIRNYTGKDKVFPAPFPSMLVLFCGKQPWDDENPEIALWEQK